jgi:hypothetical protein
MGHRQRRASSSRWPACRDWPKASAAVGLAFIRNGSPCLGRRSLLDSEANGGIATVYAATLRDAQGAGRLSVGIMAKISKSLTSRGLGHVPFDPAHLPTGQWDLVRVFNRASPVGEVIVAAHEPGDNGDNVLREAVNGDAREVLERVRDLVCRD